MFEIGCLEISAGGSSCMVRVVDVAKSERKPIKFIARTYLMRYNDDVLNVGIWRLPKPRENPNCERFERQFSVEWVKSVRHQRLGKLLFWMGLGHRFLVARPTRRG